MHIHRYNALINKVILLSGVTVSTRAKSLVLTVSTPLMHINLFISALYLRIHSTRALSFTELTEGSRIPSLTQKSLIAFALERLRTSISAVRVFVCEHCENFTYGSVHKHLGVCVCVCVWVVVGGGGWRKKGGEKMTTNIPGKIVLIGL